MKFTVDSRAFDRLMQTNLKVGEQVMEDAYDFFVKTTPKRSGNARRNTHLDRSNNQIDADYSYAEVLDKGRHMTNRGARGSTFAPRGMSKPTLEEIDRLVNKHLKEK